MENLSRRFVRRSRSYLSEEYLPKIRRALEGLSQEDLWWRPNEASNSMGNLILHLAGNVRQWVVAGIGGEPDVRKREEEFRREGGMEADALLEHLERAVQEADAVLAGLTADALEEPRTIQGMEGTVFDAVYHVVEHFSMHVGQILYISKARSGRDLALYEIREGKASPRW